MLARMANRMRPPQPQRVIECTVDRLGVIASLVQPREVRVGSRDGPDILCAVETALVVVFVAVQPDGDGAATEAFGESVLVGPAELPLLSS